MSGHLRQPVRSHQADWTKGPDKDPSGHQAQDLQGERHTVYNTYLLTYLFTGGIVVVSSGGGKKHTFMYTQIIL